MFMLPTVFSVPNSYNPDISMSSSWDRSEENGLDDQNNAVIPTPSPIANNNNNSYYSSTPENENRNSNVHMSLAAADRERNAK